jgi:protein-disulfide isomerase
MGPENAAVTVVEVFDYACPACGNFTVTYGEDIATNYFDSEDVNWVYFPYSLPQFRDRSPASSAAALCMAEQGEELFHAFHTGLFNIQTTDAAHTRDGFDQVAEEIGADTEAFSQCLEEGRYRTAVEENMEAASLAAVSSTPSFYVNGRLYTNIGSFAQIAQIIDPLIAQ